MYTLLIIFILIQVSILLSLIIILITKKNKCVSLKIEKYLNILLLILNLITIYFNPLSLIIILLLLIYLLQIKIKNENLRIIISSASLFISLGVYIITILGMYYIWYVFGWDIIIAYLFLRPTSAWSRLGLRLSVIVGIILILEPSTIVGGNHPAKSAKRLMRRPLGGKE